YYYFDIQEFLLWNYTAINNGIPYRDIFYPYGMFNYFRNYNLLFAFTYYLIPTVLFTIVYFIFKKIFKDKLILYFSIIIFYLFTLMLTGFQIFSRYGLLAVLSLFISYVLYSNKRLAKRALVCLGIVAGLLVGAVNDQAFYLIISFIFIYLLNKFIHIKKKSFSLLIFLTGIIKELIFIIIGFLIGIIPLVAIYNGSFLPYFSYFKDVGEIVVVSKTPFFSFIDSPANIFTISILFFAIFYNFLKLFFFKHKFKLSSFLQTSLIITILIMEQKSIIRSIDRQITFVSLILFMFIVYELANTLISKNRSRKIIYIIIIAVVVILYGFKVERPTDNYSYLFKNYGLLTGKKCFDNNLKFFSINNPSYVKIINLLKEQQGFNGKVFTFPTGDSAFYILLNQKPPYYNAIFEGASYEKQNSTIKYIQENKIEYAILNTNKLSLQDAVPDYVRQNLLFEYILNNYQPFAVIGDHIILRKMQNNDFFASEVLKQAKDYENYLSNVYLYKIPFSEGLYKYNYLKDNNKLITEGNISKINFFLAENNFFSKDKVIVLIPNADNKSQSLNSIIFRIEKGLSTTIYFNPCIKNNPCIINLSRIPLFYKERLVEKIIVDMEYKGKIRIFDLKNSGNLW
ncbi:MAG: hypothetical protein Q8P29_03325, partial [Candidatus Levybacteria bacterium]|nr:hypothetical protein [Candidatus Levybacteria bacterium]